MRYIDADKFIAELEREKNVALEFEDGVAVYEIEHTMNLIGMQPTADVVPKSEYDAVVSAVDNSTKEFLKLHDYYQEAKCEIDKWKDRCIGWYEVAGLKSQRILELEAELSKAKGEVEQIFEEIEKYKRSPMPECKPVYVINYSSFAELKKKYTEGET